MPYVYLKTDLETSAKIINQLKDRICSNKRKCGPLFMVWKLYRYTQKQYNKNLGDYDYIVWDYNAFLKSLPTFNDLGGKLWIALYNIVTERKKLKSLDNEF